MTKVELLKAFEIAISVYGNKFKPPLMTRPDFPFDKHYFVWEDLLTSWPSREESLAAAKKAIDDLEVDPAVSCQTAPLELGDTPSDDEADTGTAFKRFEVSDEESDPSSSSSSSAGSTDYVQQGSRVPWVKAKKGLLHLTALEPGEGYEGVTACGRILKCPCIGYGITEALTTQVRWSPRCFAMLEPPVRDEWTKAFDTS